MIREMTSKLGKIQPKIHEGLNKVEPGQVDGEREKSRIPSTDPREMYSTYFIRAPQVAHLTMILLLFALFTFDNPPPSCSSIG